jgi:hypothetical protein
MDRRGFLRSLVGGVAVAAAVRTFPFRVYSFPPAPVLAGNEFLDHFVWYTNPEATAAYKELLGELERMPGRIEVTDVDDRLKIITFAPVRRPAIAIADIPRTRYGYHTKFSRLSD